MEKKNIIEKEEPSEYLFEFERFELYQRAIDFADNIHNITKNYPVHEKTELSSQLRRASNSISLNLAEGFSNYYTKDKKKYFRYARGSVFECIPALRISLRQHYLGNKEHSELYHECFEISRRIVGLINSIDNRLIVNKQNKK